MALVLVYDFLFGLGLQVGGQLKQVINRNKTSLQAALARMKVRAKVVNNEDLLPPNIQEQQGGFCRKKARNSGLIEVLFTKR
jgi:putative methyltransferase